MAKRQTKKLVKNQSRRIEKPVQKVVKSATTEGAATATPLPEKIVQAAIDLLKTKAPHQLTYREIAAHAGVSHMAPYRYFKSIEDIFLRIGDDGARKLGQLLREATEEFPLDPERQLREAGQRYMRFAMENPIHFSVMTSEIVSKNPPAALQCRNEAFEVLLQMIRNCQLKGLLPRKENSEKIAFTLWAYIHGLTQLHMRGYPSTLDMRLAPKDSINFFLNAFMKGLGDN